MMIVVILSWLITFGVNHQVRREDIGRTESTLPQVDLWVRSLHTTKQVLDTPRASALSTGQRSPVRSDATLKCRTNRLSFDRQLAHPPGSAIVRLPRYPRVSAADEASRSRRSSASISFRVLFLRRPLGQTHSSLAFSHDLQTGLSPEHLARLVRQRKQAREIRFSLTDAGDCGRLDSVRGEADTMEESDMIVVEEGSYRHI